MKVLWILAICILTGSVAAQELEIIKSDNSDLVKFASSAILVANSNAAENISVRLFILHNNPGSAGFDSGEVTHNIIIAVSEFDEYPLQNLFTISEFLNPQFVEWKKISNNVIVAIIEHGIAMKRKKENFRISIENVKIEEQNL